MDEAIALEFENIKNEIAELRDLFLRRLMEDKSRLAMQQALVDDLDEMRSQATQRFMEPFLKELLLAVDRLNESQRKSEDVSSFSEEVHGILERWNVFKAPFAGTFDPRIHELVGEVDPSNFENLVELRAGYLIGERLLRPTLIKQENP